jgi:uncharacterized protein (TIGR02246 family)
MAAPTPEQLLPMVTAAINAGDPAEVLKYWDEEGCFVLPDGPAVRGHADLLELYQQRLAVQPEMTSHVARIVQAGDVALVVNEWSTRLRNGEIEGNTSFHGTATLVLRRDADDNWRILVDALDQQS